MPKPSLSIAIQQEPLIPPVAPGEALLLLGEAMEDCEEIGAMEIFHKLEAILLGAMESKGLALEPTEAQVRSVMESLAVERIVDRAEKLGIAKILPLLLCAFLLTGCVSTIEPMRLDAKKPVTVNQLDDGKKPNDGVVWREGGGVPLDRWGNPCQLGGVPGIPLGCTKTEWETKRP